MDGLVDGLRDGAGARGRTTQRARGARWSHLLGWVWFLSCLWAAGTSGYAGVPLASLLYLVSGCMSFPPLWRLLTKRNLILTRGYRTTFGILAVFGAAFLMVAHGREGAPPRAGKSQAVAANTPTTSAAQATDEQGQRRKVVADGAMEARNKAKIAELLTGVNALEARDYEGQMIFWKQITALAPENGGYARKRQELAGQLAKLEHLRTNPEEGMIVEQVRGRKAGFGNVLMIEITLRNDSLSNLKDFQITCQSKGKSGTVLGTNTRVLYEIVEARRSRTFRKINMGFVNNQAASTNCVVDQASVS